MSPALWKGLEGQVLVLIFITNALCLGEVGGEIGVTWAFLTLSRVPMQHGQETHLFLIKFTSRHTSPDIGITRAQDL
jgi:hypothetical protein